MANYDDVVEQNKKYLTQAQINALAAASKEYNVQNAGNRASAVASAREQYDAGYRGLQNMGLAGGLEAQATSGEVPRLQAQVQTNFDRYNQKLSDVEHQRLSALGANMAAQTQAARAAAAAAQRARMEAAGKLVANSLFDTAKKIGEGLVRANAGIGVKKDIKATPTEQYDEPIGPLTQKQYMEQQQRQQQFNTTLAAAQVLGVSVPNLPAQMKGNKSSDAYKSAVVGAALESKKNPGKAWKTTPQDQKQARQNVNQSASVLSTGTGYDTAADKQALTDAENRLNDLKQKRHYGGKVTDDELNSAQAAVDTAKMKVEQPQLYAAYVIYNDAASPVSARKNAAHIIAEDSARKVTEAMGYTAPSTTEEEFKENAKLIPQLRRALNVIDSQRIAQENKRKTGTTGADYEQYDINDNIAELKKLGFTEQEARDFVKRFDNDRYAKRDYDVFASAYTAYFEHNGEKPSKGVNSMETDATYRAINNLPDIDYDPDKPTATRQNRVDPYVEYMTPDERAAYNNIYWSDGVDAANKYAEDIKPIVELQRADSDRAYLEQLAREKAIPAWLLARGTNLVGNIPAMAEKFVTGAQNVVSDIASGGATVPTRYSYDSSVSRFSNWADIIQSEQSRNILQHYDEQNKPGLGKVMNFVYQTGTSMADSAIAMVISGAGAPWMTDALFFSSAGNQAYKDIIERGGTQEQAMASGVLNGVAEALFEHVSIEHFLEDLKFSGPKAVQLIKSMLSQGGTEASEEVCTEIVDILTDVWVMDDKSEFEQLKKEYGERGAYMELLKDVGMAGLGGLASGLGFGALSMLRSAPGDIRNRVETNKIGEQVINSNGTQRLIDTANILGGDAATLASKASKKQTSKTVGDLAVAVNNQQKALYDIENADAQTAVTRFLDGGKMDAFEARTIMDTIGADTIGSMGYDVSSPRAFKNSYNARLEEHNIKSNAEIMSKIGDKLFPGYMSRMSSSPSSFGFTRSDDLINARAQQKQQAAYTAARANAANNVWANPEQGMSIVSPDGRKISPMPGNMTAVEQAEQERTGFKARSTATKGNVTYAVAGMEAREGLSNEQTYSEIQKGLTKEARQKAQLYEKLASALGVKMIIHDVMTGTNGFIDEKGNMHVVLSGKQSVLRVAAHELTHLMKENAGNEYASMRDHLISEVGQEKFDRMTKQKANEYGIDLSTEKGKILADDEVCAELCERMLSNEDALEKFAEKDTAAAKTLKEHLLKILNAIKDAFKRAENRDFGESWSDLIRQQDTIESWITGLQKAIDNANARSNTTEGQIANTAGVTSADQAELIDDIKSAKTDADIDNAISEHSVDVIEYDMAGYAQDLFKAGMTQNDITVLFDTMNKAVDMVKAHRAILDFGAELNTEEEILAAKRERAYLPYKQNADPHYKLALDFSTLCRKRVLLQSIQERLQAQMGRALTQEETVAIRLELQKLQREGYKVEVACALCYVEAARLKSPKVINTFLNNTGAEMRNYFAKKNPASKQIIEGLQQKWKVERGLAPDATKDDMKAAGVNVTDYNNYSREKREQFESDNAAEKVTIDRAVRLANNEKVMIGGIEFPGRETFLSASWLTKLKSVEPDIFNAFTDKVRSATRSKAQETDTFYSRGDIDMVTESILNYANAESGFRHQSWSDFVPTHLLDTMAAVIEMSTRKAKMHAYTKVPSMVRLLGKTGMALNMSLIPAGDTGLVDGSLSFDSIEGMPWETMTKLRDMFPDTAGNIAIGINGEQIQKLLASNDIDYVIPYHASGMNKNMRGYLDIRAWSEYTSSQNEKTNHRGAKGAAPELAEWFDEKAAAKAKDGYAFMRAASEKYLQLCYERNLTPKFSQYLTNNGDGSYSLKEGYENYWKMLTDRKMVNQKTGKVIIQEAVKPIFDQDTALGILEDRLADPAIQDAAEAADIVTDKFSGWQADRNNASAEAIQESKNIRDRTAAITAQKTAEASGIRYSIDTDAIRQAFTVIDTAGIEDGLEALKDVKHVGSFALKDISRFLDASAGKNKDLRNTLHAIFEAPHSEATGRYARGVERMQERVLDIAVRAGAVSEKDVNNFRRKIGAIRFDSKKSAAIQNIGEGFSNTYTDLKLKVKDADHVTVKAYEPGTDKLVVSEKDYTLKELRQAYGTNAADYVWSRVFDETQKAQETGGKAGWVEENVNTRPYTLADLQTAYPNDWQKLKGAADEFRQMYDEYIRDQNNMLATIYPIESEYADVEKLDAGIEKKQERLAQHKAAVNTQIENLQKSLEAKEKEIASKKRTDTKAYRQLVEQAGKLNDQISAVKAEIMEYEANVKDELVKMNTLKAEMQNAVQKGDYSLKRMHRLQYRSDYFHHFTEMASGIQNLKSIFTNNTDIAPAIVGKSENTKAKTKWAGYFQQRMGGDYTADALNGMLRYGQLAEYKLAFDPLTAYLRDVNKQIRNMSSDTNRDGLIRYIDQWADTIAGKSHKLDRVVSDSGMAPRKAMQVLQWINSRVIQNTLLWNMRSALIQISNITNAKGIVKNNIDWVNGLKAWALAVKGDEAMASIMAQSNFLASRYMDGLALTDSKLKSAKQLAGWMLGALDEVSAKATWWAAYQQYTRNPNAAKNQYRNYEDAVDYADDITRRTHAGRGVGELAPAMTSRVINFVAPFQVEVNNTWQLLKDNVKQKNYLGLLSTGLSVFLFNSVFEYIVGSTPLGFDFIRAVVDIVMSMINDDPDDDPDAKEIGQRFAGELVGGLPFASQLVAAFGEDNAKKLLGENNDATRYGNTQIGVNAVVNAVKGLKDIGSGLIEGRQVNWIDDLDDLLNLTLPMGAKQLTRTAQGIATVANGYAGKYDNKGDEKVQFVTDRDFLHYLHAGLFGKWALTEASEYFGEKRLIPELFGKYHGPKSSLGTPVDAKEYKAALSTGIGGKDYFTLKYDLSEFRTAGGKREKMMQQAFTPEQKAKLDTILFSEKDDVMKTEGGIVYKQGSDGKWNIKADYTSHDMFELSQMGEKTYMTTKALIDDGFDQEMALTAAYVWNDTKDTPDEIEGVDDRKLAFRNMLFESKAYTVEQKQQLDAAFCNSKNTADYTDRELFDLSVSGSYSKYEKAAEAKKIGVPVATYEKLTAKKAELTERNKQLKASGKKPEEIASTMRREIMNSNLTVKQKETLDDLLVSSEGRNPDYSSNDWFEISMLGKTQYDEAKGGQKIGLNPNVYLAAYSKYKEANAKDKDGKYVHTKKEAKKILKEYLDKLPVSAPVYDYIWTVVFNYKKQ